VAAAETEAEHPDLSDVAARALWPADYVPTKAEEREADDLFPHSCSHSFFYILLSCIHRSITPPNLSRNHTPRGAGL
jgi:hypothetical protein